MFENILGRNGVVNQDYQVNIIALIIFPRSIAYLKTADVVSVLY